MRWSRVLCAGTLLMGFGGVAHAQMLDVCPNSPNCVNTYQADDEHVPMEPLVVSRDHGLDNLVSLVDSMPRTSLIEHNLYYAHFEFEIAIFGFVDDVEFAMDTVANVIHFRSASRKGYYDFGVNKRRMEEIAELWNTDNKNRPSD